MLWPPPVEKKGFQGMFLQPVYVFFHPIDYGCGEGGGYKQVSASAAQKSTLSKPVFDATGYIIRKHPHST